MTHEEKSLLLRDLCSRLPFNVIVLEDISKKFDGGCITELVTFTEVKGEKCFLGRHSMTPLTVEEVRPFLRPMSSMAEEEKKEFYHLASLQRNYLGDGNFYTHYQMID